MAVLDDYLTPQQRHVEQLSLGGSTPPPVAPAAAQVVDRQAYWQEQRQMQEEQQQRRREVLAQAEEFRRKLAEARSWGGSAGVGAESPRYQSPAASLMSEAPVRAYEAEVLRTHTRQSEDVIPKLRQVNESVAQYTRPVMQPVRNAVGDVIRASAPVVEQLPVIGQVQQVGKVVPRFPTPTGVGAGVAEGMVPVEPWEIALELLPGIGTVPGVTSFGKVALRRMLAEEGLPATRVGVQALIKKRTPGGVRSALAKFGDESGMAKIPGKAAGDLPEPKPGAEGAAGGMPASAAGAPPQSLAPVREAFSGKSGRVQVGTRVFATDRNNFGRVVQINPDGTAKVYFKSPRGGEAYVDMSPDVLNPLVSGGRRSGTKIVPLTNAELEQSWELLPARNQKFVGIVAEHSLTETKRAELLTASRSRKAGNIADIARREGSADEKLAQMWAARKGADLPEQPALREFFDDEDIAGYQQDVIDAVQSGLITPHEAANAGSILNLIMDGARKNGAKTPITQGERSLMGKIFGPELEKVLPTTPEKMSRLQWFLAPLHIWRSSKTAFDFGAMFRQGRKVIVSDFREWAHSSRTQLRALGQKGYERVQEVVHASPYYSLGQSVERPLGIMEQGGGLSDEFLSPLTKPSTGTGVLKRAGDVVLAPVRASERVYNAFLNTLRQGMFDKNMDELVHHFGALDQVPMSEVQRIIDNINTSTMFGNISGLGDYSRAVSQTMFSVRGLVSAPQFYGDFVRAMGPNASPAARKIIARRFASVIASDLATLGGIAAVGAYLKEEGSPISVGVNMDPYSQAFGNVQVGPVKWNIWGPEAQIVRATIQAATGKRAPEGATETKNINAFDRAMGFGRTKLSPAASVLYDLFLNKQRDFQGRPIKDRAWEYTVEQAAPIMAWSMYDSFREEGFWGLAEMGQGVGLDTQVYGPSETVEKANVKHAAQKSLDGVGYADIVPDSWRDSLPSLKSVDGLSKPIGEFDSIEDAKKDYLAPMPGGVVPTRSQIDKRAAQWEALPAVKDYKAMVKRRETYILKKATRADVQAAYDAGVIDLDAAQRKELGIK